MRRRLRSGTGVTLLLLAGCAAPVAPKVAVAEPAPASAPAPTPSAPATPAPPKKRGPRPTSAPQLQGKDPLADQVLSEATSAVLRNVMAAPEQYRFQVLYSPVKDGKLERHGWRTDAEYFFPASSMKIPIVVAAYERMNAQRKAGKTAFTRDAALRIYPTKGGEPYATTLAAETWRAVIVSDNFSANRLLGVTGQKEVQDTCLGLGLTSVRVRTGFATGEPIDAADVSPHFTVDKLDFPARKSTATLPANDATGLDIGTAYVNENGQRVTGPMPFKDKNAIRLEHLQDAMIRIMRPELLPAPPKGSIYTASDTPVDDIAYLRQALGTLPSESGLAGYDRNTLADYPLSPFLRGIERVRDRSKFQIFQKVGQAYGFLIHNAYIVEKATNKAFFLTAAIYANDDGVMNDDIYGYDQTSFPALADVGEAFTKEAFDTP